MILTVILTIMFNFIHLSRPFAMGAYLPPVPVLLHSLNHNSIEEVHMMQREACSRRCSIPSNLHSVCCGFPPEMRGYLTGTTLLPREQNHL